MKEWAKSFYKSQAWIKCRNAYIRDRINVDGGICEECKDDLGYIVHHKTYLTKENINNPDISLNFDNLEYVCKKCHDNFEGHGIGTKRGNTLLVEFDRDGNPVRTRVCMLDAHSPQ